MLILLKMTTFPASTRQKLRAAGAVHAHGAAAVCRLSRLLETWCLMEYAEKGSLADALRTGRLRRPSGFPELGVIIACLQDIASGMLTNMSPVLSQSWAPLLPVLAGHLSRWAHKCSCVNITQTKQRRQQLQDDPSWLGPDIPAFLCSLGAGASASTQGQPCAMQAWSICTRPASFTAI